MNWLVFFFGVLIGWLIEWSIDFFFWRRQMRACVESNAELESELSQVLEEKQALDLLAAQQTDSEIALESCRNDLARCQADLKARENELEVASKRIVELSASADTRRTQLVKEEQRVDEYQADLEAKTNELAAVSRELASSKAELGTCRAEWSAAQARLKALESELDSALAAAAAPVEPEGLHEIEGIGPKIQSILYSQGILTFSQLAATSPERLRQILEEAGSRFRLADPSTWPTQAQLAADGDWGAFKALQDRLVGGRAADDPVLTE